MSSEPRVAVIIPLYGGRHHIGEAVKSVLAQTYENLEVIVVDDASPDEGAAVVGAFGDPRVTCIRHDVNRGANAARNTGIRATSAELIAFLDQDDLFHPDKVAAHAAVLKRDSTVGATYGPRFEMNHSSLTVRDVWRPPVALTLADVVLDYPMNPSDMFIRKAWLERVGLWHEQGDFYGGEVVLAGRLFLEGCRFAHVPRVLNYRRYHAGRRSSRIAEHCESERRAQETILADPRCPAEVAAQRPVAFANRYAGYSYVAFAQDESKLGVRLLREAVRLNAALLEGTPCELLRSFVETTVADTSDDHERSLSRILQQAPADMPQVREQVGWAVAHGHLVKGARAALWGSQADADVHGARARALGAAIDDAFLGRLSFQLAAFEMACGNEATIGASQRLSGWLSGFGDVRRWSRVWGRYQIDKAFSSHAEGKPAEARRHALQGIASEPGYLLNRGVLSVLGRSLLRWPARHGGTSLRAASASRS
jgi:glycosyltransferase involved in cell wall biosynthesis